MKKSIILGILGIALVLCALTGFAMAGTTVGGNSISVSITSDPSNAYVKYIASDGTVIDTGYTPYSKTFYLTGNPQAQTGRFEVSKNGYETRYDAITIGNTEMQKAAEGGYTETLHETLTPIVSTGTADIRSTPSGASIKIDGTYYGTTPLVVSLNAGSHTISISKSGYSSYTSTMLVKASQVTYVDVKLPSSSGYVFVSSIPSGASVYIDSVYVGQTDNTFAVSSGTHSITITKTGYGSYGSKISVNGGETSTVSAILPTSSPKGYVNVASTPSGASVYIDGSYVGITPSNGYLDAGPYTTDESHSIQLRLSGYQTYTSSFTTSTSSTPVISPILNPIKSTTGTIHVTSSPGGAAVTVDGSYYGTTPVSVPNLNAGSHTVKVSAAGYIDNIQTVNVNAGQYIELPVTLYTASPTQQSPAPLIGVLVGLAVAGVFCAMRRRE